MPVTATEYPIMLLTPSRTDLRYDLRKERWKLVEDVPFEGEPTLGLAEFLRDGETCVKGDVMVERAIELGNRAGQRHAEQMIKQQDQIPSEYSSFVLLFPGTIWENPDGSRRVVPYLDWGGGEWCFDFFWIDSEWCSFDRLVRLCEPA